MGALMYVALVLPFTSRTRNISVMVSEFGMVVLHGMLFPLLRGDKDTGLKHYQDHALRFFSIAFILIAVLAGLILFDSFAHVKKVLKACRSCCKEPDDDAPNKILDTYSSDSFTEREVSLENYDTKNDEVIELYDAKKENEKFELEKRVKEEKKVKDKDKGKNKHIVETPLKEGDALVSEFGRPLFKDTQDIGSSGERSRNDIDESDESEYNSSSSGEHEERKRTQQRAQQRTPQETPEITPQMAPESTPQRSRFNPRPAKEDPMSLTGASMQARETTDFKGMNEPKEETKEKLFYERDEYSSDTE
jgi:hypothetical protein